MRFALLALLAVVMGCQASLDTDVKSSVTPSARITPVVCPESTAWNGEVCVWLAVIADVRCPQLSEWDGKRCVATHVTCPQGAGWDGEQCVPIGQPISDGPQAATMLEVPDETLFEQRTPLPLPQTAVDAFKYR